MLERLAFYRDLIISECLPAVPGAPPGVADYLFAGLTAALGAVGGGVCWCKAFAAATTPAAGASRRRCSRIESASMLTSASMSMTARSRSPSLPAAPAA